MSRYPFNVSPVGDSGFLRKASERERKVIAEGIAYWDLFNDIDDERAAEWHEEFGDSERFPYVTNGPEIHRIVCAHMAKMRHGK